MGQRLPATPSCGRSTCWLAGCCRPIGRNPFSFGIGTPGGHGCGVAESVSPVPVQTIPSPFCSCNVPTSSQFCRRAPAGFRLPAVASTSELSLRLGVPFMRSSLLQLLSDFLSPIVFLVLYLLTDSVTL